MLGCAKAGAATIGSTRRTATASDAKSRHVLTSRLFPELWRMLSLISSRGFKGLLVHDATNAIIAHLLLPPRCCAR